MHQLRCLIGELGLRWFVKVMPEKELPTYLLAAIMRYSHERLNERTER